MGLLTKNPLKGYRGSKKLRRAGLDIPWTFEQILEFDKCRKDPEYFLETYVKIIHPDRGIIDFNPRPFQKEMVRSVINNRYTAVLACRQSGKCLTLYTNITIRNKKTGEVITITGEQFREMLRDENPK